MNEKGNSDTGQSSASRLKFNPNYIGLVILIIAFVLSLIDILKIEPGGQGIEEERIVNVLHWQLEPGFREALDSVIRDYNALPHVVESGYKVKQMAVTERVYNQFLNVHLISGTAPDLSVPWKFSTSNNKGLYYDPFEDVLERPNPYNTKDHLPEDLDVDLREFLRKSPWKETFVDGLRSVLNASQGTGYYYAIPIASQGTIRLYYNKTLLREIKSLLQAAMAGDKVAEWLKPVLSDDFETNRMALLPDTPVLRKWLSTDRPPETFGQLLLLCEATQHHSQINGNDKLVPVAGSSYSRTLFQDIYNAPFFYAWEERLDLNLDGQTSATELFMAYKQGKWDFDEPRLKAYFELQTKLATYFPAGFLGLDREQANRRFILRNALFLATGSWDAAGIKLGASQRANPSERFEVGVISFPMPAPGERWGQFRTMPNAEGVGGGGVPLALYRHSTNKTEATDFLQYLTSFAPNKKFVQKAGWLPSVIGPEPIDYMKPFLPVTEGVSGGSKLRFIGGNIGTRYNGQYQLLISGDITYDELVGNVRDALNDERNGIKREWYEEFRRSRESIRNTERGLSMQRFRQLRAGHFLHENQQYAQILYRSANGLGGLAVKWYWNLSGIQEPFPEF